MAGEMGYDTGPYVNLAVFCEQVIEDKDGVLTIVRIIDDVTLKPEGPEKPADLPPGAAQISTTLVLAFKPGKARGTHAVRVEFEHPDTTIDPKADAVVHFTGGPNNGANVILRGNVRLTTQGLYWANVYLNNRLMTKIPLQVKYDPT